MSSTLWSLQRSNGTKVSNWSYQNEAYSAKYYYQIPILILLEFTGIMGNTLAIVMTIKMLRYKGNLPQVLVLYLSLVDILTVLCTYTPSLIAKLFLTPRGILYPNHWLCQFQAFTMMTLLYYSSGMIVIMSIERLLAIKMPVWYKVKFKPKAIYITMAITLLFSMILNFLPLFGLCQLSIHFNSTCFWNWNLTNPGTKFYSYTVTLLSIILVVTLFIITIITIMAVKRKNKIADRRRRKPITENRASGVLISTGFLFVICWLPFSVSLHFINIFMYSKMTQL